MPQSPIGVFAYSQTPSGTIAPDQSSYSYVECAASTTQALGAAGSAGDVLQTLVIVPATTSPGQVQIKDGSGTAITVFTGGATSVTSVAPVSVSLNIASANGGWSVISGANVSVLAVGKFA